METAVSCAIVVLCVAVLACVVVLIVRTGRVQRAVDAQNSALAQLERAERSLDALSRASETQGALLAQQLETLATSLQQLEGKQDALRRETTEALEKARTSTDGQLADMRGIVDDKLTRTLVQQSSDLRDTLEKFDTRFSQFQKQLQGFQEQVTSGIGEVRSTVETQLKDIRSDNGKQLDEMRRTVDEKLSATLNDRLTASFKQVSDQLESVYKGLGDMRNIASGVGDLKRVLSNVKTRGILGEVQLKSILSDILAPEQYEENVATKPDSSERVEFAVKVPVEGGGHILLPIDSKFPGDTYEHLRDAMDSGDAERIAAARKQLETRIKGEAKDIQDKYISVPETTNFAILFLPFEGLYAEVVNIPGLIVVLQRDYRVNVAGPSTMAALLNSLQMSYQTFALQKRADEIQRVLSAVKAEFPKYQDALRKASKQINTAGKTVDELITTRTNVIERKLADVTALEDEGQAARILGMDAAPAPKALEAPADEGE